MEIPKFVIKRHKLIQGDGTAVPYERSPNQSRELLPQYLVMHYTAGRNAESSIAWLTNREAKASAHIVIGRDGSVTQLVSFNRRAWHAGRSEWNGSVGMNNHSIGIELDNAGKLTRRADGWHSWFDVLYPEGEVVEATHKHHNIPAGWHAFPQKQIEVALGVATAIVRKYDLVDVIGHDDVAPHRKEDPGPAFPMLSFQSRVMGREQEDDLYFETTTDLSIRYGPGTEFERLPTSPLPEGTRLIVLTTQSSWKYVEVVDSLPDQGCGVKGWVSGRFLRAVN